jgi:hypothetical protein
MRRAAICLSLAFTVSALGGGAAVAESGTFKDGKTTSGPMDIHRVSVANEKRLQVRVKVEDLQPKAGASAALWIDTDKERKGPEFVIGSGLYDSDWQLSRADGWKAVGDPLNCDVDQALRYKKDVISWTTGKDCLGTYTAVRVSAETQKRDTNDYSPAKRKFHPWVERG